MRGTAGVDVAAGGDGAGEIELPYRGQAPDGTECWIRTLSRRRSGAREKPVWVALEYWPILEREGLTTVPWYLRRHQGYWRVEAVAPADGRRCQVANVCLQARRNQDYVRYATHKDDLELSARILTPTNLKLQGRPTPRMSHHRPKEQPKPNFEDIDLTTSQKIINQPIIGHPDKVAMIDPDTFDLWFKPLGIVPWGLKSGVLTIRHRGGDVSPARVIMGAGKGQQVRYKDKDPLNLRTENLYVVAGSAKWNDRARLLGWMDPRGAREGIDDGGE